MMEAIAELGKRRYPSSLAARRGGALGYDRLATLQDILQAGLSSLSSAPDGSPPAAAPPEVPTSAPPEADWLARLEALEREVARLKQPVAAANGTAKSSEPASAPPASKTAPAASRAAVKKTKASAAKPATAKTAAKTASKTASKTAPKATSATTSKAALESATAPAPAETPKPTTSRVKKAKTPSRRRRSSSKMSQAEIATLTEATSLSKNSLASLCRCDKRTLDRKREEGDLGKFTRARCGIEYRYKDSDSRYYPVKS